MVKKQINEYNYALYLGLGTAVVALFVSFIIIKPLFDKNSELRNTKSTQNAKLEKLLEKEKVLVSLKDKSSEIKTNSERVSSALPSSSDIGRLFIQLDELAKISGGSLKSVGTNTNTVSETQAIPGINELTYSLPLDMPSYFALKKFFESSEEALRLLSITDVRIDSSDSGALSVNLSAKSYTRLK
jgi:Tfp pilus assembly protein PilO